MAAGNMGFFYNVQAAWAALRGKAISHHPDLRYRYHVVRQEAGAEVGTRLDDYADFASVYGVYVWVQKAVRSYAGALAGLDTRVVDGKGKALDGHPLSELFRNVNDRMAPAHLWAAYCVDMLLGGESFIEIVPDSRGRPAALWPRRPDLVAVQPDEARPLYPAAAGYVYADEIELGVDECIQDKFHNPLSAWRGLAPIAAVREGITIDLFAQSWSKTFLKRGARPDFALVAPEGLTPTEREDYETLLADKFSGSDNWHKPIILEEGVTDIRPFSFAPRDIEWLEQRKFSRDEVGSVFGVPDEVMGYGRDTYENMPAAHKWFWLLTLHPFVQARDTTLTAFFTKTRPMLKPGERVATDLSVVKALQEDITEKADAAKTFWSIGYPLNVIDERLGLGFGAVQGGDEGYVPVTVMPVSEAAIRPAPGTGANPLTGQEPERETEPEQEERSARPVTKSAVPEYGSPRHKALWKAATAIAMPYERRMMQQLDQDFERQAKSVRAIVEGAGEGEKQQEQEPRIPTTATEFFDRDEWAAYFVAAYEALYTDAARAAGQATLARFELDIPLDISQRRVVEAIRTMRMKFADDINGVTLEMLEQALRELLDEATHEGWSVWQIQRELGKRTDNVFGLRRELWQRERIARTEMHKATETGHQEGARQSGLNLKKGWLAALDGRERETHREAHSRYQGSPIDLEAAFQVGNDTMQAPGMGNEPAENINCRCTTYHVVVGGAG